MTLMCNLKCKEDLQIWCNPSGMPFSGDVLKFLKGDVYNFKLSESGDSVNYEYKHTSGYIVDFLPKTIFEQHFDYKEYVRNLKLEMVLNG